MDNQAKPAANPAKPPVAQAQPAKSPVPKPQASYAPAAPKKDYGKDFRGIVRIAGKEVNGELTLEYGLTRIRGIGQNLARVFCQIIDRELHIPRSKRVGQLTDPELEQIENLLKAPEKFFKKSHYFNRPVDTDTGIPRHLIANDLIFAVRQDIQFEKDSRTWRGWRHQMNQRVRGQHSRTTGRTGMSVGVLKKALKAQKTAAASKAQEGAGGAKPAPEKK